MRQALPIFLLGTLLCDGPIHAAGSETNSGVAQKDDGAAAPKPSSTPALLKQPEKLDGAVIDGNGLLWAYCRQFPNHLYRFNGTTWSEQTAPFPQDPEATPQRLARMNNGSVACLWRLEEKTMGVSIHTASKATVLGVATGEVPRNDGVLDALLADSKDRLWIIGQFPSIYRVDAKSGWKTFLQITPEELTNPEQLPDECSRIRAMEAGDGTVWLWSEQQYVRRANLKGVFLIKDDKAEFHGEFQTSSGQKIDARNILSVINADARHLWVSVRYDGIYKVDLSTLKFERVADPKDQQLRVVQELHQVGGDLYAVVWVTDHAVLWRLHNGEWKQLMPTIEAQHPWGCELFRVPQGIVMQSTREAPWFIPDEGDPIQLTWKYGFPLTGVRRMAYFPNGTLLAIGYNSDVFCGPFQFPPKEVGSSRVIEIRSNKQQPWVLDWQGTPWTILNDTPDILSRWSGKSWLAVAIPSHETSSLSHPRRILSDAQGRIWVVPPESSPRPELQPVQVYGIESKQWQSFPSLQDAFLKIKPSPRFLANGHYLHGPEYSPDHRRIAFREESRIYQIDQVWRSESFRNFWYFDGSLWRDINVSDVIGTKDEHVLLGPPCFDKEGLLSVTVKDAHGMRKTWRMDASGKWGSFPFESRFPDDIWSENPNPTPSNRPPIPEGCVTQDPDSIIRDNHGICWLVWKGVLYKAVSGKCIRVLEPEDSLPLRTHIFLHNVYVDRDGNAFIRASSGHMMAFVIKPKAKPPRTNLEINKPEGDSVRARFLESSTGEVEFRWQLDNQGWKTTKQTTLSLKNLPNGKHTLRVIATDAELQSDATPATASFTVHVNPERQMARLIKELSDPDYDRRKEAIKALALQPALAKPALLKARATANDDKKWWIDAALQQIGMSR